MAVISDPAAPIDITLNQGATLRFTLQWTVNAVAQSLAGLTPRASFAVKAGAPPWFTLTVGNGLTVEPAGAVGNIAVEIVPAQSSLAVRDGVWDLILYDVTGTEVKRLAEGAVTLDKGVTVLPA